MGLPLDSPGGCRFFPVDNLSKITDHKYEVRRQNSQPQNFTSRSSQPNEIRMIKMLAINSRNEAASSFFLDFPWCGLVDVKAVTSLSAVPPQR